MSRRSSGWLAGLCVGALVLPSAGCSEPTAMGDAGSATDSADLDGAASDADGGADDGAQPDTGDATAMDGETDPAEACQGSDAPVIDALLVDFWVEDLPGRRTELVESIAAHFGRATECLVSLEIVDTVELEAPSHDVTSIMAEYPYVNEIDAQRLWYYENGTVDTILVDLRAGLDDLGVTVSDYTVIVALSEVQFEASAYFLDQDAHGLEPLIIVESYTLGGWALGEGYTTISNSALYLADELIHEVGHFMGLIHACDSCNLPGDYEAMLACCEACPYADDVMSYCRTRIRPTDEETNVFMDCSLDWIEFAFVPAFEAGEEVPWQQASCEG